MWAGGYPALGADLGESGTLQLLGSRVYTGQPPLAVRRKAWVDCSVSQQVASSGAHIREPWSGVCLMIL